MLCLRCYPFSTSLSHGPVTGLPAWTQQSGFPQRLIWSGHYPIYKIHFCDFSSLSGRKRKFFHMDNAHRLPAMAWFHDLFVLLWCYFFYCVFVLPFHTPGHHWVLPVCLAPTHLGYSPGFLWLQDCALPAPSSRKSWQFILEPQLSLLQGSIHFLLTFLTSSYCSVKCSLYRTNCNWKFTLSYVIVWSMSVSPMRKWIPWGHGLYLLMFNIASPGISTVCTLYLLIEKIN